MLNFKEDRIHLAETSSMVSKTTATAIIPNYANKTFSMNVLLPKNNNNYKLFVQV